MLSKCLRKTRTGHSIGACQSVSPLLIAAHASNPMSTPIKQTQMDNDCVVMHRHANEYVEVRESYKAGTSDYCTSSTFSVVKPLADKRSYEYLEVGGDGKTTGARFLLVSDSEAVFAAACLNMQAGYFDDPPDVPGFAHWLEHAVHLGSGRYPDDKDYKFFLSQHGGTSNASTGMVHTSYHFTVAAAHLAGALDRMARFFIDPLLLPDRILKEAENVHAEFSRNCNSDSRKLLQLRRSAAGGLLGKFSTGNASTLRGGAAAVAGRDVPAELAAFWRQRYLAGALCGCVVGPQALTELRELVRGAFAEVRLREADSGTEPRVSPPDRGSTGPQEQRQQQEKEKEAATADVDLRSAEALAAESCGELNSGGAAARYSFVDMCPVGRLGRIFHVASQRELRQLDVIWYLPYGVMQDIKSKPWRWAGHVLGHEGRGSLAALLRGAGLAQELTTGLFDEVRLGRGFMFWGVTLTLSEAGLQRAGDVLRLVLTAVRAMRALGEVQRQSLWREVAEAAALRWQYQDRIQPLDLARDMAQRLHYFEPESVLSGNSLFYEYDTDALERFLSYLTPSNCNVHLADSSFAGSTDQQEQWYGAKYREDLLDLELYERDANAEAAPPAILATETTAAHVDPAGHPDDPLPLLLSRLRLPQPPSWALPVDVGLVQETPAGASYSIIVGTEETSLSQAAAAPAPALAFEAEGSGTGAVLSGGVAAEPAPPPAAPPPAAPPQLLFDSGSVRLWHLTDVSFGVPKTHVYVHLITRAVYKSPAAWVTARLACRLMDELLQPDVYDAQLVGTHYGLSASETGLHLSFHGFSGVVCQLAEVVGKAFAGVTLNQVQARYDLVHGKLLRGLRLWRHNSPAAHAEYGTEHVLQLPHWHVEESIQLLEAAAAVAGVCVAGGGSGGGGGGSSAAGVEAGPPATIIESAAVRPTVSEAEEMVGPMQVWEFLRRLGEGMEMELLVYGNSTEQQARELCATLSGYMRPTGIGAQGWPATRILDLRMDRPLPSPPPPAPQNSQAQQQQQQQEEKEDGQEYKQRPAQQDGHAERTTQGPFSSGVHSNGEQTQEERENGGGGARNGGGNYYTPGAGPMLLRYTPLNPNPTNTNSAVFLLCQLGEDDPRNARPSVLLDLLVRVASKPAFHELRTRQRLGYVVALTRHRLGGGMGLAVRVQSPDRRPEELRRRVAEWLREFGTELRALSEERLTCFKSSLRDKYLEPARSLAEGSSRRWQPIRYRSYDFQKLERKEEALRSLGMQDLVAFYEQWICPSSPSARLLCCEVVGGGLAAESGGGISEGEGKGKPAIDQRGGGSDGTGQEGAGGVGESGEGGDEGGMRWQRVGPEDVVDLHRRLPHFCHSETLGVLRPLGLPLSGGRGAAATAAAMDSFQGGLATGES